MKEAVSQIKQYCQLNETINEIRKDAQNKINALIEKRDEVKQEMYILINRSRLVDGYRYFCANSFEKRDTGLLKVNKDKSRFDFSGIWVEKCEDCNDIIDKSEQVINETIADADNDYKNRTSEEHVSEFCYAYNKLLTFPEHAGRLIKDIDEDCSNKIRQQIEELEKLRNDDDISRALIANRVDEAIDLIEKCCPQKEGEIVYGSEIVLLDGKEYRLPTVLSENKGKNAVFIKVDDEESASAVLETLLPGLFEKTVHTYRPKNLRFAFIEKTNLNEKVCGQFCDSIKDKKLDSCLYKANNEKVNGYATQDEQVEQLIGALFNELDERKNESTLKGMSISEFNEKNPFLMLPYFILVVNTFSNLFNDTYKAKYIYERLQKLIKEGGDYGIFVICVGQNVVVKNNYNEDKTEFDLIENFDKAYVFDKSQIEVAKSKLNGDDLFEEYRDKLKKESSMTLESLIERKDIKIPSFYNENKDNDSDEIAIPIGISSSGIEYFRAKTTGNMASTIITGATGSGKTTFIRTLIMSGSWFYSPDQLQFYIIDFKSQTGTADFACFSQDKGKAYVPHVSFLSERSTKEQAFSLFEYIRQIETQRTRLFAEYDAKDAKGYREVLHKKMADNSCQDYAEYAKKIGKNAMPSLPQIFLVIDEANSAFSGDDYELMDQLGKRVSKIRSLGISFILCGQTNPVSDERILLNIGNRIALETAAGMFGKTFSGMGDDEKDKCFEFVRRQKGNAVFQFEGKNYFSCINTAYLEIGDDYKNISAFAKKVNDKYGDVYQGWTQKRPGSTAVVSADVLVEAIKNTTSVINNDTYNTDDCLPLYVGINSLTSVPHPIVFGEPDNEGNEEQSDRTPHNYCISAKPIKQVKIIYNMALYNAYLRKEAEVLPENSNIIVNYVSVKKFSRSTGKIIEDAGKNLLSQYEALKKESGLDGYIKVNESVYDIASALHECYDVYTKRVRGEAEDYSPYLFCLAKADEWIDELNKISQKVSQGDLHAGDFNRALSSNVPKEFIETLREYLLKQGDLDETVIDNLLSSSEKIESIMEYQVEDEAIKKQYEKIKAPNSSQVNIAATEKLDKQDALRMLGELLRHGIEQNVNVIFAYESAKAEFKNDYDGDFINVQNWKNMITDAKTVDGQKYDENLCYCKRTEVRLWDFLSSKKWLEFIKSAGKQC